MHRHVYKETEQQRYFIIIIRSGVLTGISNNVKHIDNVHYFKTNEILISCTLLWQVGIDL